MPLRSLLQLLRRFALVLALFAATGAVVGYMSASLSDPTYVSRATVMISVLGDESPTGLSQSSAFANQRTPTYAGLATTRSVIDRAAAILGNPAGDEDLSASITATPRLESALIDIDAQGKTAQIASDRANAVAVALANEVPDLDAPSGSASIALSTVQSAPVPTRADSPRPRNNTLLGSLVGLGLGFAFMGFRHAVDNTVRTPRDLPDDDFVQTIFVMPPELAKGSEKEQAQLFSRLGRAALREKYGEQWMLLVTCVSDRDSSAAKSVATQLVQAAREDSLTSLLLDLEDTREIGAESKLHTGRRVRAKAIGNPMLDVERLVALEDLGYHSAQLVNRTSGAEILGELKAKYHQVIVLSRSILPEGVGTLGTAYLAASVLLVIRSGYTKISELRFALDALRASGAQKVDLVLLGRE